MSDEHNEVLKRPRGRPPKIQSAPSDEEAMAYINERLKRPIDPRTESQKLEPTEQILTDISEFAKLGCTKTEIAAVLAVSPGSLEDFMITCVLARNAYERGIAFSMIRVRKGQYDLAGKMANMAIFLGKNKLGQKDEITTNVKAGSSDPRELSEDELIEIARTGSKDLGGRKLN